MSNRNTDFSKLPLNYTPHAIHIHIIKKDVPSITTIPSSGVITLLTKPQKRILEIEGIPIFTKQDFIGLNIEKIPNSPIIVSLPVAEFILKHKIEHNHEIYVVGSGPDGAIRTKEGQIIGTKYLELYKGGDVYIS